jgi:hypothetical protein
MLTFLLPLRRETDKSAVRVTTEDCLPYLGRRKITSRAVTLLYNWYRGLCPWRD